MDAQPLEQLERGSLEPAAHAALAELGLTEKFYQSLLERANKRLEAVTEALNEAEAKADDRQRELDAERTRSANFRQVIDDSLLQLQALSTQQEEFRSVLAGAESRAAELDGELSRERERFKESTQLLADRDEQLFELGQTVDALRAELAGVLARLDERIVYGVEVDGKLAQERAGTVELTQALAERDAQLDESRRTIEALNGQIAALEQRRDEQFNSFRAAIAREEEKSGKLAARLEEKEAELAVSAAIAAATREEFDQERSARAALSAELTALKIALAAHEAMTAELQGKLAKSEVESLSARNELADAQARLSQKLQKVAQLEDDCEGLVRERVRDQKALERETARANDLEQRLAAAESAMARQFETLDRERSEHAQTIEKLREQLAGEQANLLQKLDEISALESDRQELFRERAKDREALERESTRAAELESKITDAESALLAQLQIVEELRAQLAESDALGQSLEKSKAELEQRHWARTAELEREVADAESALSTQLQIVDELRAQLADSDTLRQDLEKSKAELEQRQSARAAELEWKVAANEGALSAQLRIVDGLRAKLADSHARRQSLMKSNAELEQRLQALRLAEEESRRRAEEAERRTTKRQAEHAQAIGALRAELDQSIEQQAAQQHKSAELDQRIAAHCREIEQLQAQIWRSERELATNAAMLAGERETAERRNAELAAIKRSRIWRLNSAFRTIGEMFTRLGAGSQVNPLFDADFYLERYPDVRGEGQNPYAHYLRFGAEEGRDPNPMFATNWYLERYPDVREAGINPLLHYYLFGAKEGRDPHPLFSTSWYLKQHPELSGTDVNLLLHYLQSSKAAT